MGIFDAVFWGQSSDDLSRAALNVVQDDLHVGSVWPGDPTELIEAMQQTINRAREWVATVEDRRVRRAYSGWLDFYEGRIREARKELTTHARQRRVEKFDKEFRDRQQRASDLARTLPRPPRS